MENQLRIINLVSLFLFIVGGINWLLVGLADTDLVATLFGGQDSLLSTLVYVLVGISALWQIVPLFRALSRGEFSGEANTTR